MGAVFRTVTIRFDGTDYSFTPSLRLLRQLEGEGVSLIAMSNQARSGQVMPAQLSTFVARCLQSAGAQVTDDAIFAALMAQDAVGIISLATDLMLAMLPEPDPAPSGKPVPAPSRAPKAKTSSAKPRRA